MVFYPAGVANGEIIVVMGVSGSGKSTVATMLARSLGLPYADADQFHPESNKRKMSAGNPLTDADRQPWLHSIGEWVAAREHAGDGGVVTCSALKRRYRDLLRQYSQHAWFLHLAGPENVIADRVAERKGHFMPRELLDSQYADLEPLEADEAGLTVDVRKSPPELVRTAADAVPGR
jgi:gluconokinase